MLLVELSTTVESNCYKLPMGSDNDVYRISLADNRQINVYCDMRRECRGGWTVIFTCKYHNIETMKI